MEAAGLRLAQTFCWLSTSSTEVLIPPIAHAEAFSSRSRNRPKHRPPARGRGSFYRNHWEAENGNQFMVCLLFLYANTLNSTLRLKRVVMPMSLRVYMTL
jgi:hypothetical protein